MNLHELQSSVILRHWSASLFNCLPLESLLGETLEASKGGLCLCSYPRKYPETILMVVKMSLTVQRRSSSVITAGGRVKVQPQSCVTANAVNSTFSTPAASHQKVWRVLSCEEATGNTVFVCEVGADWDHTDCRNSYSSSLALSPSRLATSSKQLFLHASPPLT